MADSDGEDFVNIMESLKHREEEAHRIKAMLEEHERWRQTTWAGWAVRQTQAIGHRFAPFFIAMNDVMTGNYSKNDPWMFGMSLLIRILMVTALVIVLYAIASILNSVLGREIVIEEEIIIEHEEADVTTEPSSKSEYSSATQQRVISRSKKQK